MCPSCKKTHHDDSDKCPKIFRPWDKQDKQCSPKKTGFRPPINETTPYSSQDFTSLYPSADFPINPNDPTLLETLAHGYALEEYARVLNQEHQAKILNARKQRPKKYKCPHCDVGFSNNGQLKGHIRIHTGQFLINKFLRGGNYSWFIITGERPFKCDEKNCGKTFTRNEELTRHKRIHSGLRPFPCTHCGKRFGRKDHLKKHSRTHYQPRGVYAVPVMLPFEAWATTSYPYLPPVYGF